MNNMELNIMDINGKLTIDEKIWFNDSYRCRLRICGFTKEQIKSMEKSSFIDISLIQNKGKSEFMISISEDKLSEITRKNLLSEELDVSKEAVEMNKKWCAYEISEESIRDIAERKEYSLKGVDFEDLVHYIKKGVDSAVEDVREEIIINAIRMNSL